MLRKAIERIVFGETLLPQEFTLGLPEPQAEIAVWMCGIGEPIDVTFQHAMVCAAPLTICIGLDKKFPLNDAACFSLEFCERGNNKRLLGKLELTLKTCISAEHLNLVLCEPRSSHNYCLPKTRLAAHYLFHAYQHWRKDNTKGVKMTFLERRTGMVIFIVPRPILLGSVGNRENGNIFPMNLLGELGNGYFGFALRTERVVGKLVKDSGLVAISSLPLSHGALAYQLAHNHSKQSFDWDQLPFEIEASEAFGIPVLSLAPSVKEIKIETIYDIGSHSFFLGRIMHEKKQTDDLRFCSIHGFYQAWRLKGKDREAFKHSLAIDANSKWGRFHSLPEQNDLMKSASLSYTHD
jgi:flavin reductase (DIM6/NTAB) family NADH-FMN oxidoreductase RutF